MSRTEWILLAALLVTLAALVVAVAGGLLFHHRRESQWHTDLKAALKAMQDTFKATSTDISEHAKQAAKYAGDVARIHAEMTGPFVTTVARPKGLSILEHHETRIRELEQWRDAQDSSTK